ncbi:MAG: hypothetical protein VBE63_08240 [Lamprobacter sp.]|uniref:hypothetical protein n=1 Tax=Lamprobacter sp. TaxID=3100796 RepID=UPI002B260DCB|nr:hypothetical protein [Lamprobacter sp.]MEA3639918.1 hypothetical protein [Lamprobacter sp.]
MGGGEKAKPSTPGFTQAGHNAMWQFQNDLYNRAEAYGQHGANALQWQLPHAQEGLSNAANFSNTVQGLTGVLVPQASDFLSQAQAGNTAFQGALGGLGTSLSSRPTASGSGANTAPAALLDAPDGATTYQAPQINSELLEAFNNTVSMYGDAFGDFVMPTFQQLNQAAQNFSSPGYAEHLARQVAGDSARSFAQAQDASRRANASMGVGPGTGRAQEAQRVSALQHSAQTTNAMNNARMTADQVGFDRLGAAAQQSAVLGQLGNQALDIRSGYDQSHMNMLAGLEQSRMGNATNIYGHQLGAQSSMHNAGVNARASMANAQTAANASMYGAGLQAQIGALNAMNDRDYNMGRLGLSTLDTLGSLHSTSSMGQSRALDDSRGLYNDFLTTQYNASGLIGNANNYIVSAFGGTNAQQGAQAGSPSPWGTAIADIGGTLAKKVDWGSVFNSGVAGG